MHYIIPSGQLDLYILNFKLNIGCLEDKCGSWARYSTNQSGRFLVVLLPSKDVRDHPLAKLERLVISNSRRI